MHTCIYRLMHMLVFKVWLATPFCLLLPLCHMAHEAECHSTEIVRVTQESHISKSPQTSWVAGAADRLMDNPGQGEGEVTSCKSPLTVSKDDFNCIALAGHQKRADNLLLGHCRLESLVKKQELVHEPVPCLLIKAPLLLLCTAVSVHPPVLFSLEWPAQLPFILLALGEGHVESCRRGSLPTVLPLHRHCLAP